MPLVHGDFDIERRSLVQKVSVIIPTYNSARYLPEAIESVLAQTYRDYEIIVIDDGSKDNTKEVVGPYRDRITYLEGDNAGPSEARNRGIRASSGPYVAFLDADDLWYPDKLKRQLEVFSENRDYDLVHTDGSYSRSPSSQPGRTWFSLKKKVPSGWVFSDLLNESFIILSSVVVKRESLERVGLFDQNVDRWHGYDLWLRIAFERQIGSIEAPLFFRRIHETNRFYSEPLKEVKSFITVMKKWQNRSQDLAEADRQNVRQQLRGAYLRQFGYLAAAGSHRQARQALKNSWAQGFSLFGFTCYALSILPSSVVQMMLSYKEHINALIYRGEKA